MRSIIDCAVVRFTSPVNLSDFSGDKGDLPLKPSFVLQILHPGVIKIESETTAITYIASNFFIITRCEIKREVRPTHRNYNTLCKTMTDGVEYCIKKEASEMNASFSMWCINVLY